MKQKQALAVLQEGKPRSTKVRASVAAANGAQPKVRVRAGQEPACTGTPLVLLIPLMEARHSQCVFRLT